MRKLTNNLRALLENRKTKKVLRDILGEWASHIEAKNNPVQFATLYLEILRNQNDPNTRLFCTILLTLMNTHSWKDMYGLLKPYFTPEMAVIFEKPWARKFYDRFKKNVLSQIRLYWKTGLRASRRMENEPNVLLSVYLPRKLIRSIRKLAATLQMTAEDIVTQILEDAVNFANILRCKG